MSLYVSSDETIQAYCISCHLFQLSSSRGSLLASIPSELREHVKLLLNTEPTIRPDAPQMAKVRDCPDLLQTRLN